MPRHFEFSDGKSNKFWEIELAGSSFTVRYGRIGAAGQTQTKSYDTPEKARKEHDKLVAEKVGKGYVEKGAMKIETRPGAAAKKAKTAAPSSKSGTARPALDSVPKPKSRAAKRGVSDQEAIQGLWRLVSYISRGGPVCAGYTHYQFIGNRLREIDPTQVEDSSTTFELDPTTHPKRFIKHDGYPGPRPGQRIQDSFLMAYELNGDTLRLCTSDDPDEYPDEISDKKHGVETFVRDDGPVPEFRKPSGKKPMKHKLLGKMEWDDNLNWWSGRVRLAAKLTIKVRVTAGQINDDDALAALANWVEWLRANESGVRTFAAGKLLRTFNQSWNEDKEPMTAEEFAERMSPMSLSVDPGEGAELFYSDDDMFAGHSIQIGLGENRKPRSADIAG